MDVLTVTGLGNLDGTYEFDVVEMLTIGAPGQLTNREAHRIKVMSGVRAGELEDALNAGDSDVTVSLAAIVLTRNRKRVDEELLWDAPLGSGLRFEFADREQKGGDGDPPTETTSDLPPASVEPGTNGGGSSSQSSAGQPENDPSPTGHPA